MKNLGTFDPDWNPVKPGGLTKDDISNLETRGWKHETTGYDVEGVDLGFVDPEIPSGFILYKVNVPKGEKYMYHPEHGGAIMMSCGNPTCWRHLLR